MDYHAIVASKELMPPAWVWQGWLFDIMDNK